MSGGIYRFLARVALPAVVGVIVVNVALSGRTERDPFRRIDNALAAGNAGLAKSEYGALLDADPDDIELHRGYVGSHMQIPESMGKREVRQDGPLIRKYELLAQDRDPTRADLGWYTLGYFHALNGAPSRALECFDRVRNRDLPYLNNSIGSALMDLDQPVAAEPPLRREIELGGNVRGARANLAQLLQRTGRMEELERFAADPEVRDAIPDAIRRRLDLRSGAFGAYAASHLNAHLASPLGFVAALLTGAVWCVYLRRVDAIDPERPLHLFLAVLGGATCSLAAGPLYDVLDFGAGWTLTGDGVNDALYCVFGIGLIEESLKLIPALLLLRFTTLIDESVDYVVYGALSGLGFAVAEILVRIDGDGLSRIAPRAFTAVVLHMSLTGLAMYAVFASRRKAGIRRWLAVAIGFVGVCVLHGAYDFWMVAKGVLGRFPILSVFVLIVVAVGFAKSLVATLNVSEKLRRRAEPRIRLSEYLAQGFAAILLFQYAALGFRYGIVNANVSCAITLFSSFYVVFVLAQRLGTLDVQHGEARSIFPWDGR